VEILFSVVERFRDGDAAISADTAAHSVPDGDVAEILDRAPTLLVKARETEVRVVRNSCDVGRDAPDAGTMPTASGTPAQHPQKSPRHPVQRP